MVQTGSLYLLYKRPDDIKKLRKICTNKAFIMAKIEKPSALEFIEENYKISGWDNDS